MLLSDRDILAAQSAGHISLDPWTPRNGAARFHRRAIGSVLPFVQ